MVKKCLVCGNMFITKPSKVLKGNGKFCSKKCYHKTWVGRKHSKEAIEKIRINSTGVNNPMFGISINVGEANKNWIGGKPKCFDCGKQLRNYHNKRCFVCSHKHNSGKNNHFFIDGRTPLNKCIRGSKKYINWRSLIFIRDGYKCVKCGKNGNLHVDHKKQFALIFSEFLKKYNQFSPIEDKETLIRLSESYDDFWDNDNAETLCVDCHKKTESYLRRISF